MSRGGREAPEPWRCGGNGKTRGLQTRPAPLVAACTKLFAPSPQRMPVWCRPPKGPASKTDGPRIPVFGRRFLRWSVLARELCESGEKNESQLRLYQLELPCSLIELDGHVWRSPGFRPCFEGFKRNSRLDESSWSCANHGKSVTKHAYILIRILLISPSNLWQFHNLSSKMHSFSGWLDLGRQRS